MRFRKDEMYGLTNQLRRREISVPSNMLRAAAGKWLKIPFISGTFREARCLIANTMLLDIGSEYMDERKFNEVFDKIQTCKRLLNGFINYYKKL